MPPPAHPLADVLAEAAAGRFPPVDGRVEVVPPYLDGVEAMVSFTGHAVAVTSLPLERLLAAGADGFAGATSAPVMAELAGPDGELDVLDVLLAAPGTGPPGRPGNSAIGERRDLDDHPRVRYARRHRGDVRVYGDDRGLVTLSRGLGGLPELSFAVPSAQWGRGMGRSLLADARDLVHAGEPLLAAVAPGNAASLRALLSAGFVPLGSVQLVHPGPRRMP